jgi:hypothetical protein
MLTLADALPRLAIDLVALAALTGGLFQPRHRRMELVVVYALFNVGLFLALLILVGTRISLGVGFGLFAVLSIVRLRSDTYSHRELAYFFVALASRSCAPSTWATWRARRRWRRSSWPRPGRSTTRGSAPPRARPT